VYETKTKYMHLTRNKKTIHELKIGEYKLEGISGLSSDRKQQYNSRNLKKRGGGVDATYYRNRKFLTTKLLTRNIKLRLYLTLIGPILTYGAETGAATESELQKLLIFERKILRRIYGPVKDRDNWRIRTN
jgi:hypothetical protein